MNAFAVLLFGNSHTAVNFRVPLSQETHDPDCTRNCLQHSTLAKLQRTMQQAARRATRYFTGYLRKPQPVGKKELEQAAKQLHYLHTTDATDPTGKHYRKVATRVFGDLEFRCSVRPITEEFMLAGFGHPHDPTAAECIRTFPVVPFVGCEWLSWLDGQTEHRHKVETNSLRQGMLKLSEVYGWRGTDIRVRYLSPWEFVKWWSVKKLQPPGDTVAKQQKAFSVWAPGIDPSKPPLDGWKFGRDFHWKKNYRPVQQNTSFVCPKPFKLLQHKGITWKDTWSHSFHSLLCVHCQSQTCRKTPKQDSSTCIYAHGPCK